jgi:hypothetical protein
MADRPHRLRLFASVCALVGMAVAGPASALTIFGSGPQPEAADIPVFDPTDYELGTVFESSIAGQVTALRFYLGPVEGAAPGTIVGRLWTGSGTLLASETFGSLAVGWNEVALSTPVAISASTTYVVSANTNAGTSGTGSYAVDQGPGALGFFGGGGYTNGPLTATSGVFTTTVGAFPTSIFPASNGGSNYLRDVAFVPEPSTLLLVSLGLVGLSFSAGRRRSS